MYRNHILVGLGGTGGKVLKAFKKRMFQEFELEERNKIPVGFVYVDSTDEMMHPGDKSWYVHDENAQFDCNEFLYIKSIAPATFPGLKGVIGDPEVMKKTIGNMGAATGQMRRAGRILFGAHVSQFCQAMTAQFAKCKEISGSDKNTIFIFSGLAGGTGSGAIVDVIAQIRKMTIFSDHLSTQIVVFCMAPTEVLTDNLHAKWMQEANIYAALSELNGLLSRQWQPFDVSGEALSRMDFRKIPRIVSNLVVVTNEDENGHVLDFFSELPVRVSDYVYSASFMPDDEDSSAYFQKTFDIESQECYVYEYWEEARNGSIMAVRTKRTSAIGIRKIIIPEEDIKQYLTAVMSRQVLLHLLYNNWHDDMGWRDTPTCIDWGAYVRGEEKKKPLEAWHMTDAHLMLDLPILKSDEGKWVYSNVYWAKIISKFLEQDVTKSKQPIATLNELCAHAMESGFRNVGIKPFFAGKKEAREQIAGEIVDLIEKDLFTQWINGSLSLFNLNELIDSLIGETQKRITAFQELSAKIDAVLKGKLEKERLAKAAAYNQAGFIMVAFNGRKLLDDYGETMFKVCHYRTKAEACDFAVELLPTLIAKLNLLRSRVEKLADNLKDALYCMERAINATEKESDDFDIRFYEADKVKDFACSMVQSRKNQVNINAAVRADILNLVGTEKTFARTNATIDQDSLNNILEKTVREKVISFHDTTLVEKKDRLFHRNILNYLEDRYPSKDDLSQWIKDAISNVGSLARFNTPEVQRNIRNNHETSYGRNILRRSIWVLLPKKEFLNPKEKDWERLFRDAFPDYHWGGVIHTERNQNEITILYLAILFPFRCLEAINKYKDSYDFLTTESPNMPASEVQRNIRLLHGEDFEKALPDLFVAKRPSREQLEREYMPYLMLAYAMGIIRFGDLSDDTGRQAWGIVEIDEDFGLETIYPLADQFTGIRDSSRFDEDFCENIKAQVESQFRGKFLYVEGRINELRPKIQELLKSIILPETGGNASSKSFLDYIDAARTAIDLLK